MPPPFSNSAHYILMDECSHASAHFFRYSYGVYATELSCSLYVFIGVTLCLCLIGLSSVLFFFIYCRSLYSSPIFSKFGILDTSFSQLGFLDILGGFHIRPAPRSVFSLDFPIGLNDGRFHEGFTGPPRRIMGDDP